MIDTAGIYGKSLYDLAAEENLTEEILPQMEAVKGLFDENPDYIRLLQEPSIHKAERLSLLDEAFGGSLHPYLLNFLKILLEKDLLRQYSACLRRYRDLYNKDHGITDAVVTSAVALSDEQVQKLKARLESMSGKKVIMHQKINPDILGGLKVEIDGKELDGTVKGRLSDIRRKVNETVM